MTPHDFLDIKMALSARFRFSETSGYRYAVYNDTVGGHKFSLHQCWLATDVALGPLENVKDFLRMARRLGLVALDEGDHIHLQAP